MGNRSKWVSVYIFHEIIFEKVIIELIKPIIEDLKNKELISSYFFIRYWDNGPHIRLRLLSKNDVDRDNVISIISFMTDYFFNMENQKQFSRIEFPEYIREIDRYGGDENIENVERHFEASSRVIINLIQENYSKWEYSLAISYAIQMHIVFAKTIFKNDKNSMIYFFQKIYSNWFYYSIKLNENEKFLEDEIKKVKLHFENSYLNQKVKIDSLVSVLFYDESSSECMNKWLSECKIFANSFTNKCDNDEQLYFVYDSLIHMTNNRLGIHLRDESYIAFVLYKSFVELMPINT
jgi:thiopeptide-type bacteriocin biosynthesis protein